MMAAECSLMQMSFDEPTAQYAAFKQIDLLKGRALGAQSSPGAMQQTLDVLLPKGP